MALTAKQERIFLNSALFSGCDIKHYRGLARSLSPISIMKGQQFDSSFAQTSSLCFILEGSLDICNTNGVLFSTLNKGDFFEPISMLSHITPILPLQIRTRRASVVTFVDKDVFIPLFHSDQSLAHNYARLLSDQLQLMTQQLLHFTAVTPSVALALYLMSNQTHNRLRLTDGLAGLSRRLNVSRATLYRALGDLEQRKLVSHRDKTILILDADGMKQYIQIHSQAAPAHPNE